MTDSNKEYSNVPILDGLYWPTWDLLGLEQSQYNALFTALTNELVVIQGPPGTGKTFLGLQVIKMLLHNCNFLNGSSSAEQSPILIVCYTNNALDQLLMLISKFSGLQNIIRFGGGSKEECLEECSLFHKKNIFGKRSKVRQARVMVRWKIKTLNGLIWDLNKCKIFSFVNVKNYFSSAMLSSLFNENVYFFFEINGLNVDKRNKIFFDWLGIGDLPEDFTTECFLEAIQFHKNNGLFFDIQANEIKETAQSNEGFMEASNYFRDLNKENTDAEDTEAFLNRNQTREIEDDFEDNSETTQKKAINKNFLCSRSEQEKMNRTNDIKHLKCKAMSQKEVDGINDMWSLNPHDRIRLYRYLYKKNIYENLNEEQNKYKACVKKYENEKAIEAIELIKFNKTKIIGMTTTGAAKNQSLLRLLKPKVIIVEEAAEVFESSIVACLTQSCEQLILIGDNEQLSPRPNLYKLSKHYHLNVSLFERLVNNKIPKVRLNVQHRMRPEISFLMKYFYDDLIDHETVNSYENIKGVEKSVFYSDHNFLEDGAEDSVSKSNNHEAEYLTRLCNYLLFQNYTEDQIKILVAYGGQLLAIKNKVRAFVSANKNVHPNLAMVKITSIDSYQGEENDIILLSLVRSNNFNTIGFLAQSNRVCVALSRAKKGFYVIGNFSHLAQCSLSLWSKIKVDLEKRHLIGKVLNVYCQRHPQKITRITKTEDFNLCLHGGCAETCNEALQCGHKCEEKCHVIDHKHFKCVKSCLRILKFCSIDHKCKKQCNEECDECHEIVDYKLKCGHNKNVSCRFIKYYESESGENFSLSTFEREEISREFTCDTIIDKYFENCGHTIKCKCAEVSSIECNKNVNRIKENCGHTISVECSKDVNFAKCENIVPLALDCGHAEEVVCHKYQSDKDRYGFNAVCRQKLKIKLDCGHVQVIELGIGHLLYF